MNNNYIKLITILNEIRLPENATICYFHKNKPNDITTCTSISEIKHHVGYFLDHECDDMVFEVHFENSNNDYQFSISWFDDIINNNEFILNILRHK